VDVQLQRVTVMNIN